LGRSGADIHVGSRSQEEYPTATELCETGRKALQSYNPFWANVHVYWATLLDSWHAARWQDKTKENNEP